MDKKIIKQHMLDDLYAPYARCTLCPLATAGRTHVVFGRGNPNATLLLIGEGPGKEEDLLGLPFKGRSGKLLSKALQSLEINEDDLYITNIVKCRPPQNRAPLPHEINTCMNLFLKHQISIINPVAIGTLGATATQSLICRQEKFSILQDQDHFYATIPVIPIYHPAYILRNPKAFPLFLKNLKKVYKQSQKLTI